MAQDAVAKPIPEEVKAKVREIISEPFTIRTGKIVITVIGKNKRVCLPKNKEARDLLNIN